MGVFVHGGTFCGCVWEFMEGKDNVMLAYTFQYSNNRKKGDSTLPFLDILVLSLVPFPPSQNPVPFFPIRTEWQIRQSSGR